jgi:hypothetical protein
MAPISLAPSMPLDSMEAAQTQCNGSGPLSETAHCRDRERRLGSWQKAVGARRAQTALLLFLKAYDVCVIRFTVDFFNPALVTDTGQQIAPFAAEITIGSQHLHRRRRA